MQFLTVEAKTLRLLRRPSVVPHSRVWDFPSPSPTQTQCCSSQYRPRHYVSYTDTVFFLIVEAETFHLLHRHSVLPHSRGWDIPSPTQTQCSSSQYRPRHVSYTDTVLFLTAEADTLCFLHRHSAIPPRRGWLTSWCGVKRIVVVMVLRMTWHDIAAWQRGQLRRANGCDSSHLRVLHPLTWQRHCRTQNQSAVKFTSLLLLHYPYCSFIFNFVPIYVSTKYMGESSDFQGYSKRM